MENHENDEIELTPVVADDSNPQPKVKFIGVLAADPRMNNTSTPLEFRNHSLIRDQFFYTVPVQLLKAVCRKQQDESAEVNIDEGLFLMDLTLSRISGNHGQRIGFWKDIPINCDLMTFEPLEASHIEIPEGNSATEVEETVNLANQRLLSFSEITRGYAGWLTTNPVYNSELSDLLSEFHQQMSRWGTASVGLPMPSSQPASLFNPTNDEGWSEYEAAVLEFCVRWRLFGLAGPRVPIPMRPLVSGQFPLSIVEQLMRASGVFNWPDTFPLFSRDELRGLLSDALRNTQGCSEHLAGWRRIIDPGNRAKNQIGVYERRFVFQHFWHLLRERYPQAFDRRVNRIERAFAEYFGVDESSIRADRAAISKQLGTNWDF